MLVKGLKCHLNLREILYNMVTIVNNALYSWKKSFTLKQQKISSNIHLLDSKEFSVSFTEFSVIFTLLYELWHFSMISIINNAVINILWLKNGYNFFDILPQKDLDCFPSPWV
jgi:hypothetical protein